LSFKNNLYNLPSSINVTEPDSDVTVKGVGVVSDLIRSSKNGVKYLSGKKNPEHPYFVQMKIK
jgi:hypothetical protein